MRNIILYFLFIILLAACSQSNSVTTWTFLVYLDGDNDLASANLNDMVEMQVGAAGENIRILVQFDQPNGITAKRYEIKNHVTTELEDIGEVNMADGQTLTDFLLWAKTKKAADADRLILILSDHGNGWDQRIGASTKPKKAKEKTQSRSMFVDYDNLTGSTPSLANYLIREAIEKADINLDILGLDASSMGTIEVLDEFSGLAPIIISSQEVGYAQGWDYDDIFSRLADNSNMSASEFSTLVVKSYERYFEEQVYSSGLFVNDQRFSIAAHDTQALRAVVAEANALSGRLILQLNDAAQQTESVLNITSARESAQPIDLQNQPYVYVDLSGLSSLLEVNSKLPALIKRATIAEYHGAGRPNASGVSIVFFQPPDAWTFNTCDPDYKNWDELTGKGNKGRFINETQWDELLANYYRIVIPSLTTYNATHPCNGIFNGLF